MADWYAQYQEFKNSGAWRPTKLSEKEEAEFQRFLIESAWFKQIKKKIEDKEGIKVNDTILFSELTGPESDYDYRGAWKNGLSASDYQYDNGQHWPSSTDDGKMLKSPKHETAWMEFFMRETGVDPNELGLKNAEEAKKYTEHLKFDKRMPAIYHIHGGL